MTPADVSREVWTHDKSGANVGVYPDQKGWTVEYPGNIRNGVVGNHKQRSFDTKEDARDFAVKWMRNHPKG